MSLTVVWLGEPACSNSMLVGGKAANLSRLAATHRVPPGFCLPAQAQLSCADITLAYRELADRCGTPDPAVAVRSSALDEDSSTTSFAGQYETFLNVRGLEELHDALERCLASLHAPRALAYRRALGLAESDTGLPVLVQQPVPADASGVLFSANPMSGSRAEAVVTTSWGLGESVVGGTVSPDTYVVRKADLAIVARHIGPKLRMTVAVPGGTAEIDVPEPDRRRPVVSDAQCIDGVRLAIDLEAEMGWPVDVECAWQAGRFICCSAGPLRRCRPPEGNSNDRTTTACPPRTDRVECGRSIHGPDRHWFEPGGRAAGGAGRAAPGARTNRRGLRQHARARLAYGRKSPWTDAAYQSHVIPPGARPPTANGKASPGPTSSRVIRIWSLGGGPTWPILPRPAERRLGNCSAGSSTAWVAC